MTTGPTHDQPQGGPQKDPGDWATGDEPATQPQLSYLETLSHDSGEEIPNDLTKAQASEMIDRLRDRSPRIADEGTA